MANDSIAYEGDLMGKTYCWLDNSNDRKIVAMITLANAGIQTTHLPNNPKRHINKEIAYNKQGRTYPAVLIGRLGVAYYERNGFKPLFRRESDEKAFYDIFKTEELRTRMYYFDLLTF